MRFYRPLILIALVSLLAGLSRGTKLQNPPETSPTPVVSNVPSPVPAGPLRIIYDPIDYYSSPAQRLKVKSAAIVVNKVLQSQCYADFMKAQKLTWTDGRTPSQVVEHVQALQGRVPVKFYYSRWSSAVAYRQPPSAEININTKYLGAYSEDCEIGGTMAHEMLHALGEYDHSYEWTKEREYTVPYKTAGSTVRYGGDAFGTCCEKVAKGAL